MNPAAAQHEYREERVNLLKPLCLCGWHAWRTDESITASSYHHINPEKPPVEYAKREVPRKQTCHRCGRRRIWSFSRGCWRRISRANTRPTDA